MIRPGFLDKASRQDLIELARDGSAAHRLARRANALVLLDDGMSCTAVAKVLLLDDDTSAPGTGSTRKRGSRAWRASATKAAHAA
jgi:transposase